MHITTGLVEKLLGFNPDVIVSFGSQKFTSLSIGQKLKDMQHVRAKSILVLPAGERPVPADLMKTRMDALMEAPIVIQKLIEVMANLTGLEVEPIFIKLKKAQLTDPSLDFVKIGNFGEKASDKTADKVNDPARSQKYQKFVQALPPIEMQQTTFVKSELKKQQAEMEKGWDPQLTESINELKKEFVEALFKKK
jgi:hypothetical protein